MLNLFVNGVFALLAFGAWTHTAIVVESRSVKLACSLAALTCLWYAGLYMVIVFDPTFDLADGVRVSEFTSLSVWMFLGILPAWRIRKQKQLVRRESDDLVASVLSSPPGSVEGMFSDDQR